MESFKINATYPFLVWIATIALVAPLLVVSHGLFFVEDYSRSAGDFSWIMLIPFGMVLSLPVLIINYLIFYFLTKKGIKALGVKLILCITSISGILLTFHIIGGSTEYTFDILYSVSVVLPSFLFRVFQVKKAI